MRQHRAIASHASMCTVHSTQTWPTGDLAPLSHNGRFDEPTTLPRIDANANNCGRRSPNLAPSTTSVLPYRRPDTREISMVSQEAIA